MTRCLTETQTILPLSSLSTNNGFFPAWAAQPPGSLLRASCILTPFLLPNFWAAISARFKPGTLFPPVENPSRITHRSLHGTEVLKVPNSAQRVRPSLLRSLSSPQTPPPDTGSPTCYSALQLHPRPSLRTSASILPSPVPLTCISFFFFQTSVLSVSAGFVRSTKLGTCHFFHMEGPPTVLRMWSRQ
jgi:hypothetical protein